MKTKTKKNFNFNFLKTLLTRVFVNNFFLPTN